VSVFAVCCLLFTLTAHAQAPRTFSEAKKIAWKLYAPQSTEFYCGCKYTGNRVDLKACGYVPRKNASARRASSGSTLFRPGRSVISASAGRRVDARTAHATMKCSSAEADLHNLVPSIGEVNGDRSNFSFGWLPVQSGQYGSCLTQVDFKAKKVMPRPSIRGMIARLIST
jgi:deoxyribonuclease-1